MAAAQEGAALQLQGRATKSAVLLRWATTTPLSWKQANAYGFTIERITMMEGGKLLKNPVRKVIAPLIKPALLPDWEPYQDDDFVAVAAQSIYGETFETQSSGFSALVNTAKELENRFSFALYACDQSVKAAKLSGLYFEDQEVFADQKYLYRVYANVPNHLQPIDTGTVFIGLNDYHPLPSPQDLKVEFGDQVATISWNATLYARSYNAFWVERSDNGKDFQKLTTTPFVPIADATKGQQVRAYKIDSLPFNHKNYWYQIVGISPFGELSPPSDTVSGGGLPRMAGVPFITGYELLPDGKVKVLWDFPEGKTVKMIDLFRENQTPKRLDPVVLNQRTSVPELIDPAPVSSNYYIVRVHDFYGQTSDSFPYLVQLEDSIPPMAPVQLTGSIDTLGKVILTWAPNTESDLYGYQVYRSNFRDNGFIAIPGPMTKEPRFTEQIPIKNLTRTIYYQVRAFDHRNNASPDSEVLELEKPDVIPPVAPLLTSIRSDSLGILIQWQLSPSTDVAKHLVYKRAENDSDWTLIKILSDDDPMAYYLDREVVAKSAYAYTMLAIDHSGLESTPAIPLVIRWNAAELIPSVKELNYVFTDASKGELEFSWSYTKSGVAHFQIFKGTDDHTLQLYKTIPGDSRKMVDVIKLKDLVTKYRVMAVFENGERSEMSSELIVKF